MQLYLSLKLFSDAIVGLFIVIPYIFELWLSTTCLFPQNKNKFPEEFLRPALLLLILLVHHNCVLFYLMFVLTFLHN